MAGKRGRSCVLGNRFWAPVPTPSSVIQPMGPPTGFGPGKPKVWQSMNSDTFNKWAGALLSALLLLFALRTVINESKQEGPPAKPGYEVAEAKEGSGKVESAVAAVPDPPVAVALKTTDVEVGKGLTRACQACHSFDKGGPNKVGPNLWNIVSRKAASAEGYAYSDALKAHGGNWGYEELYKFLAAPKATVPGTKMTYAGLPKFEDRANVLAYLRTLSDAPVALP